MSNELSGVQCFTSVKTSLLVACPLTVLAPRQSGPLANKSALQAKGLRAMAARIISHTIHLHCSKFLLLENLGCEALKTQATAITNAMGRELLQSKSTLLRRRFRMQHNHFNQSRDTPDLLGVRAIPQSFTIIPIMNIRPMVSKFIYSAITGCFFFHTLGAGCFPRIR